MATETARPLNVGLELTDEQTLERWTISYFESDRAAGSRVRHAYGCVNLDGDERVVFEEEIVPEAQPPLIRPKHPLPNSFDPAIRSLLEAIREDQSDTGAE